MSADTKLPRCPWCQLRPVAVESIGVRCINALCPMNRFVFDRQDWLNRRVPDPRIQVLRKALEKCEFRLMCPLPELDNTTMQIIRAALERTKEPS